MSNTMTQFTAAIAAILIAVSSLTAVVSVPSADYSGAAMTYELA